MLVNKSIQAKNEAIGLTGFRVRERRQRCQYTRHRRSAHDRPIQEERIDPDRSLAHMHQPLRNSHNEQAIWFLVVVSGQLPEHLRETSIIGTCADETHGEDGVESDLEVIVVGVFGECVEDGKLWV